MFLFGSCRVEFIFSTSPASGCSYLTWLKAPSSIFKASNIVFALLSFPRYISLTPFCASLLLWRCLLLYWAHRDSPCSSPFCIQLIAAKLLQLCPTLCDPIDGSPLDSPVPGILQARTLEWVAISFFSPWKWSHSVVSNSSRPHGMQPTRLLRPWDFPGKSTGVGCHCLLRIYALEYI